jgi:glycosyltransferase involved in cell wall biosynthesis
VRISIITPSLRQSDWLKLCVASVADQQCDIEHIVQDAGSDDGTLDWLCRDARVKAFVEKDAGMYDAINRGFRRATGEILAYLNCDEQYLPGALVGVEQFFRQHPKVELVFGDVIIVDSKGDYLCHRKTQAPLLYHTWTCHLSTLTCATFFRRSVIDRGGFFNPDYRSGGDGEWMVRLLGKGTTMGALREFTSAFTRTGKNLGQEAVAKLERARLRKTAPLWVRGLSPLWVAQHRLRRLFEGSYHQAPFRYALYTLQSPNSRVTHQVEKPTFRCPDSSTA